MKISSFKTAFWRPINLLRSRETRLHSQHTSAWGLARLMVSMPRTFNLERAVERNLEDRFLSGRLSLKGLIALVVKGPRALQPLAEAIILRQEAFHDAAVTELAAYLNDKKLGGMTLFENYNGRETEFVEVLYPLRAQAQKILRHLSRIEDGPLQQRIGQILRTAPSCYSKSRLLF